MVHQEKVRSGRNGQSNGSEAGVDRGGNASHAAEVGHLQSVGSVIIILDFTRAQQAVAISDKLREGNICHERDKSRMAPGWEAELPYRPASLHLSM